MVMDFSTHDSPLYGSWQSIISAFARVDIPVLDLDKSSGAVSSGEFDEGEGSDLLLYTDADVVFQSDIRVNDVPYLPSYFAAAPDIVIVTFFHPVPSLCSKR